MPSPVLRASPALTGCHLPITPCGTCVQARILLTAFATAKDGEVIYMATKAELVKFLHIYPQV